MKKGYKIATSDSPDFEFENSCTFWNKNEWLALSFYDKKKEREQKKCEADVADGILLVELRLLNKKVVNQHSAAYYSNARKIECFVNSSKNDILDIAQTIVDGYFNMMMVVDATASTKDHDSLADDLAKLGDELGVQIKPQREEIFDMMHRI